MFAFTDMDRLTLAGLAAVMVVLVLLLGMLIGPALRRRVERKSSTGR